jgi:hypothetical protein
MSAGLGREDIRVLLDDLSAELAARGARAELFLVGGAALAVAYDATRSTRDLDAVFIPSEVVRQAATAVAEREGLAEEGLNDEGHGGFAGGGVSWGRRAVRGGCSERRRLRSPPVCAAAIAKVAL